MMFSLHKILTCQLGILKRKRYRKPHRYILLYVYCTNLIPQIERFNHVCACHNKFHVPFGIESVIDIQNMEHCTPQSSPLIGMNRIRNSSQLHILSFLHQNLVSTFAMCTSGTTSQVHEAPCSSIAALATKCFYGNHGGLLTYDGCLVVVFLGCLSVYNIVAINILQHCGHFYPLFDPTIFVPVFLVARGRDIGSHHLMLKFLFIALCSFLLIAVIAYPSHTSSKLMHFTIVFGLTMMRENTI